MAAAAAALPIALPLAEKGIQASVDLAKSFMAQISDALRTPLVGFEQTRIKSTRRGEVRTVSKANLPAWFIVGGLVTFAWWSVETTKNANPTGGFGSGIFNPFWWIPGQKPFL